MLDLLHLVLIKLNLSQSWRCCWGKWYDYCLSVCPSVRQSTSIHPSVQLSILLSVYLSNCLSFYLSILLSVYLSVRLSVCLSIHLSVYPSTCLYVCLAVYSSSRSMSHRRKFLSTNRSKLLHSLLESPCKQTTVVITSSLRHDHVITHICYLPVISTNCHSNIMSAEPWRFWHPASHNSRVFDTHNLTTITAKNNHEQGLPCLFGLPIVNRPVSLQIKY